MPPLYQIQAGENTAAAFATMNMEAAAEWAAVVFARTRGKRGGLGSRNKPCDKDGPLTRHHGVPTSRRPNGKINWLNVIWHERFWHGLFINMTTAEACRVVQHLMTRPPMSTELWGWQEYVNLRNAIMHETDQRVALTSGVDYWTPWESDCSAPIDLARISEPMQEMWMAVFYDLCTVQQVHLFINTIMVPKTVWRFERIRFLQNQILAGKSVIHLAEVRAA